MFNRVLVANRGEIAVRVIRALHELGVEAVAVYSTADEDALHVRLADRAVRIGPPAAAESYLNIPALIAAAETTGCEAVHPGYGFVSENADFVRACEDNDLVFIGPPADVMERMGDKARAKAEMRAAGVPLVPGTEGVAEPDAARAAAEELGFPVLLKAAAGGGGKGMRVVTEAGELQAAYERASAEAKAAFGDGSLYVEKVITPARHVEVQVLCDNHGHVPHLRRARVLGAAPPPEADRGVAVARRSTTSGARRWRPRPSAPAGTSATQRRHLRVPRRAGRLVLLHRDEHAAPGRAPGHGDDHRHRPRAGAGADRGRRRARPRRPRRPAPRPRDRAADQRRGSRRAGSPRRRARIERFRPPLGPGVRVDTLRRGRDA